MPLEKDDVKGGLKKQPDLRRRDRKRYTDTTQGTLQTTTVDLPADRHITVGEAKTHAAARRASRVSDPQSGTGRLASVLGGEASYDRVPMLRPEDIADLHRAGKAPVNQMIGRIVSDPFGVLTLGQAAIDLNKNRDLGSGVGAGLAAAGVFLPGLRGAKRAAEAEAAAKAARDAQPVVAGAKEVVGSLGEARKLRAKQERGYSQERAQRIAEYQKTLDDGLAGGLDPEEAHRVAMRSLAGELPKLEFTGGKELSRDNLPDLFNAVQEHPALRPFERVRTREALLKILDGRVPQKSEIKLLEKAFGAEDAKALAGSGSLWRQARDAGISLLNVPRALKASLDVSAPFRQGLVLGARHPRMFARELKPMFKALKSEGAYDDVMNDIAARPTYQVMRDAKLALTDLESVATREEQFMSNLAETITGGKRSPVRASGRAYVAFLNKFRADAFDNYLRMADDAGIELGDKELRDIASWVNHATGRGSIKGLEGAMPALNTLLFSPRLMASRLQLLNPTYYASLSPFARKQALAGMRNLVGAVSLTLFLANLAGAKVGLDPRSADFGKIKVGNTRVDVMGGFQQYMVAASRLLKGEMVSSTSGKLVKLEGGFAKPSRADIAQNFVEGKLAPVPRFLDQWAKNENDNLEPFNPAREAPKLFEPLGIQNAVDTYRQEGPAAAGVGLGLGSIGFGVQTYKSKAEQDLQKSMKDIDDAVKAGRLDAERANEARRKLRRVYWVQTHPSKKNQRLYLIEQMQERGGDLDSINRVLAASGYDTATQDDLHDAELAMLEAEATR